MLPETKEDEGEGICGLDMPGLYWTIPEDWEEDSEKQQVRGYTISINGKEHRATLVNGKMVYDPPIKQKGKIKEVLESRQFPGVNTDTTFLAGRGSLEKQFGGDTEALENTIKGARAQGYNPKPNDVYIPTMAKNIGDPDAFLSAGDGKGKVRDVCEKRGWSCEGSVKVKGH